jgi:flagellin
MGISNVMDLFLRGRMASADRAINQALERLSTGKRINRASDDPSGFQVADRLKVERIVLEKSIKGAEIRNTMLAAKDGALSVISDMTIELQGIVVRAANRSGLGEGELEALQIEADSILNALDYFASTSTFKGDLLLQGFDASSLGLRGDGQGDSGGSGPDTGTGDNGEDSEPPAQFFDLINGDLEAIQDAVDVAAKKVTTTRAASGALMQSNESDIRLWMVELEATSGALSRIEDADYAAEISNLVRGQILKESSMRGLMINRAQASTVLNLLSG